MGETHEALYTSCIWLIYIIYCKESIYSYFLRIIMVRDCGKTWGREVRDGS